MKKVLRHLPATDTGNIKIERLPDEESSGVYFYVVIRKAQVERFDLFIGVGVGIGIGIDKTGMQRFDSDTDPDSDPDERIREWPVRCVTWAFKITAYFYMPAGI